MSFVGSLRRGLDWAARVSKESPALAPVGWTFGILYIATMWLFVLPFWYFFAIGIFGWLLIPFRLFRRSSRKSQHLQATQLATMQALLQQNQLARQAGVHAAPPAPALGADAWAVQPAPPPSALPSGGR
jgi:hypothetical protein